MCINRQKLQQSKPEDHKKTFLSSLSLPGARMNTQGNGKWKDNG